MAGEISGGLPPVPSISGRQASTAGRANRWLDALSGFWTKLNNDWIFNLAGLLAYNFLMALFPLLLLLLAACGVVLQVLSPQADVQLQHTVAEALPGTTGSILVQGVTTHLKKSAGLLLAIGLVGASLAGSRLFVTLEGCFGIIFRLRGRDPLQQNRMAFGMLALYLLVVPLVFVISIVPTGLVTLVDPDDRGIVGAILSNGARLLVWFAAALVFCGTTYMLVPNRHKNFRSWRRNWKGTVVAAALLVLYEGLFRLYQQNLLHADNYGTIAGFALVILLFLYYLAFILLLGAEVNSWAAGQRATAADLPGLLHAVQAHRTLRGAAGPTAGMVHEEMQHHSRSRAVRYAEALLRRASTGRPLSLRLPRYHRPVG
jgi:membrane protein